MLNLVIEETKKKLIFFTENSFKVQHNKISKYFDFLNERHLR